MPSTPPPDLYTPLPPSLGGTTNQVSSINITSVLPSPVTLPSSQSINSQIRYRSLHLDTSTTPTKLSTPSKRQRRRPRFNLPAAERKYALYAPLRALWREYAQRVMAQPGPPGDRVLRMDLHGADVHVVHSRDPTLLGVKGVLVAETANTIVVVTEQNRLIRIAKAVTIIRISLQNGKAVELKLSALRMRAAERSARKIKKRHYVWDK